MIKTVKQDLLKINCDIICQQVNCQGKMGAGLASAIRKKYPYVYEKYKDVCDCAINKKSLLGKCLLIDIENNKFCANLFGQYYYGNDKYYVYTDYNALKTSFVHLKELCKFIKEKNKKENIVVAIPYKIGCGLANGDWKIVFEIINGIFSFDEDIIVYICSIE